MRLRDVIFFSALDKGDIVSERKQCIDEGKDISSLEAEFEKYSKEDYPQNELEAFFEKTANLPTNSNEPSDYESIMALCKNQEDYKEMPKDFDDKLAGGIIGKIVGCELGKPLECTDKAQIENYLRSTNNFPIKFYATYDERFIVNNRPATDQNLYYGGFDIANSDDDINFAILNMKAYKEWDKTKRPIDVGMGHESVVKYEKEISPIDIALCWLTSVAFTNVATAEQVAYKNFTRWIEPPLSATVNNPYREWVGARIRADFWGWINPLSPREAAKLAWTDACISHIKNGIYGEMFASAMISNAYHEKDIREVIIKGLNFVPTNSRLYKGITDIIKLYDEGKSYDDSISYIRSIWDEKSMYDWTHVISNTQIVVTCLLWGEDFLDSIKKSIYPGFDTDSNGATVGSIMGVFLEVKSIPKEWYECFNDTLETTTLGYNYIKITDLIKEVKSLANKS